MSSQGTHHYVLTLQAVVGGGVAFASRVGTVTPHPGATRHDIYLDLRAEIVRTSPDLAQGSVLFFDLQPNQP
ncbi:hypothetical protein ABZX40_13440 [Streptomyces sp. NPDC004610]|uniref:hypothetical protein n=1 Tax=unclassified Streptomyces TaxID=2593676 RepID=UPI0033AEBDFE